MSRVNILWQILTVQHERLAKNRKIQLNIKKFQRTYKNIQILNFNEVTQVKDLLEK